MAAALAEVDDRQAGRPLAYIDIFSMILLLSLLARAATILYVMRQAVEHLRGLIGHVRIKLRRPDSRPRRVRGAIRRWIVGAKNDEDGPLPIDGMAWA